MHTLEPLSRDARRDLRIAVLIPCYNEAVTVGRVVAELRNALPKATVFVYDNNSTDGTKEAARQAGALVRSERLQGKGNVVRRMFADVEADVYLLIDGDGTYDASAAPQLVDCLLRDELDMVTGVRIANSSSAYRLGHQFGNRALTGVVANIFGNRCGDMLSGYRAFSRRFVKSFPALAVGFEIETELTVHALELRMPIADVPTRYGDRAQGTSSKLHTVRDGVRIGTTIIRVVKEERPLQFFTLIALLFSLTSLVFGYPLLITYFETGQVPRLPTAILAMGLMIIAVLSFTAGVILDSITSARRELRRLRYLDIPLFRNELGS
ncbi:MAG TPA: glycosyltransferase [Steroidobacteraceae bacterium]|jgi:glycosyltransferase involved in cell wall biosynthesis|nr:glycosyltransferase [Steroidobacteraceae bacterium]